MQMHQDRFDGDERARAVLRIRLAGIALAATLLVLTPRSDQTAAGAALLGYATVVLLQRFGPRGRLSAGPRIALAIDILFAAALSYLLPLSAGTWALYAFAIGTAAIGFGATGAAVATAAAILAYDLVIALRASELRPSDLWPVQLILAIGLLIAELVWVVSRADATRRRQRTFALAQHDLIAARDEDALLDRLTDHAVRSFGATSAWVEVGAGAGRSVRHPRGPGLPDERAPSPMSPAWVLDESTETQLRGRFDDQAAAEIAGPAIRDLVSDATPLLIAARERSRLAHANGTLTRVLDGVRALERDRMIEAVFAELLRAASAIAGPAALVRPADGSVVAGDLAPHYALALLRDTTPPALVSGRENTPTGAVVAAGPGLALVTVGTLQALTEEDLGAIAVLGEIAAAAVARIAERDELVARGDAQGRELAEVGDQLRAKDDAVASVVHELRTPLTSVHAYAQLTSRNLQAVQQQVKQLDRLIADLLGAVGGSRADLQLEDVDLLNEVKQAGRSVALVSTRRVSVSPVGAGPFTISGDRSRIVQVIDNLLSNAVKFSPPEEEIDVEVERNDDDVVIAVTDHGSGIPADELARVFDRHYRGAGQRDSVGGDGIGLAIARDLVSAHGGRIWVTSDGPGTGSTFFVALPVAQPRLGGEPLESSGDRGSGDKAAHQA
jgi:signal transduction histidine kinase